MHDLRAPWLSPYESLLDEALGAFSLVSAGGVRLTHDPRRTYNKLILAREWSNPA